MKRFYPGEYLESSYIIDYKRLYNEGYRGIIFDIDNTLVEHGVPADEKAIALFKQLRGLGFQCCAISNNKEARVKPFADAVGIVFVHSAKKPSPANYHRAIDMMGTDKTNTLFVGDQLFTDVWGANRAGIRSILVKPINKKEEIQIVLKRYLEKIVLFFYKRKMEREGR